MWAASTGTLDPCFVHETLALLDAVHHRLASPLRGFGLELSERELPLDDALGWLEYRCTDDDTWCLLSITVSVDGLVLAEFWRAAVAGRPVELLEQAQWRYAPGNAETLMASLVGEIERWLEAFASRSVAVS